MNKKTNLLPSTLAGYVVASLIQSLINTYHSHFNQFQRFLLLGLFLLILTGKKKETVNIPVSLILYPLQSELLFQFLSHTYTPSLQFRLSSSSDNHCRESLTYLNDCRTNPSGHHPHILPLQLTHIKKLPSDKTPKSLHV